MEACLGGGGGGGDDNNSFLYYLCAGTTATKPFTDMAEDYKKNTKIQVQMPTYINGNKNHT
jgi:Tfp pilus assembly PilM family ATPase